MRKGGVPDRGDVVWVVPDPTAGSEMKGKHLWLVLTPFEVNRHGLAMMVAISTGGGGAREAGFTVRVVGERIRGVAVCTQVRTFDWRVPERQVAFHETVDLATINDVVDKVTSLLDPS